MKWKPFRYLIFGLLLVSCESDYTPRPHGYPRIDLPEAQYKSYAVDCPFSFEFHDQSLIAPRTRPEEACWFDIIYPRYKAKIHVSYKAVEDSVGLFIDQSRSLAYKHAIKADNIIETPYINPEKRVFGLLLELTGNSASTVQFYATDSTNHFLRGALYFNVKTNEDSLRPVIDFITDDIAHLMETLNWKD